MKAEWRVCSVRADFNALGKRFNIDPVVARVICNRGLTTESEIEMFLNGQLSSCYDGGLMLDMDKAVDVIGTGIRENKSIRIVGDYDVDGVTSTYILYDAMEKAGGRVSYDIPHRITDGYGINTRIIEQAHEDGVDIVMTCDNGIAAFDAFKRAEELGLTVVITDHHEIQDRIPEVAAAVDPHRVLDEYPFKSICGAMVAYKFIRKLYSYLGLTLEEDSYLDFVALGTVCDVMPIVDENRVYVKEGLKKLKNTENIGMRALLEATGLADGRPITSYHLGFVIGPCINTAGRLGSAKDAEELFLSKDAEWCRQKAEIIKKENDSRKNMTEEGTKTAIEAVEAGGSLPDVLVIYLKDIHESLAGIIAGKLKEHFYRPTIVFTDADNAGFLKGSGRSIEGYNLFEELTKVGDLLYKFGGHTMAAGLTIEKDKLEELRDALNKNSTLTEKTLTPKLMIDVPMPFRYVTMRLINQLDALAPFGTGNDRPIFAEADMKVLGVRVYGKNNNVMKLKVRDSRGANFELLSFSPEAFLNDIKLWFGEAECDKILKGLDSDIRLDIAYQLEINSYNGVDSIQFNLKTYQKS